MGEILWALRLVSECEERRGVVRDASGVLMC